MRLLIASWKNFKKRRHAWGADKGSGSEGLCEQSDCALSICTMAGQRGSGIGQFRWKFQLSHFSNCVTYLLASVFTSIIKMVMIPIA